MSVLEARTQLPSGRCGARRRLAVPLGIFIVTRLVDALMIAWFARDQVAGTNGGGWFVAEPVPASPGYWAVLANFDGQWYKQIVEHGYPVHLPVLDGAIDQNAWAFYPLYPTVVRVLMGATRLPFEVVASGVSLTCGAVAMCLLFRTLERRGGRFTAVTSVLALSLFPVSVVFQAAYTESLALLELVVIMWSLEQRRYGVVALATLALAFTRPIVIAVALTVAIHGIVRWRQEGAGFTPAQRWRVVGNVVLACVGFGFWPGVAAVVTGTPNAYVATQQAWATQISTTGRYTWAGHLLGHGGVTLGLVGISALAVLVMVVVRRGARVWGPEWRAWMLSYGLYLFLATRATGSVLRMAVLLVVPWWPAAEETPPPSRSARVVIITGIVLFGLVSQWLWVQWLFVHRIGSLAIP